MRDRPSTIRAGYQVAAAGVVLDQATKHLAQSVLERGESVAWLGPHIGWQLVYNPGGAYGIPMPSWFFLTVTVVVVGIVARNLPSAPGLRAATAYGLLLAGALGNAIDRVFRAGDPGDPAFFHGHVIDFVAWGSFPRFNIADSAITIGFALLVLDLWRQPSHDQTDQPSTAGTDGEPGTDDAPSADGGDHGDGGEAGADDEAGEEDHAQVPDGT